MPVPRYSKEPSREDPERSATRRHNENCKRTHREGANGGNHQVGQHQIVRSAEATASISDQQPDPLTPISCETGDV